MAGRWLKGWSLFIPGFFPPSPLEDLGYGRH